MAFNPQDHMLKLKGKDYLQVMWRLVWFREEHPDWSINTNLVSHDPEAGSAVFKCSIIDTAASHTVSTGYGSETRKDFGDYLEKAETKSVGRALAMLGYGTQFAPELDEGDRIVDSPVDSKKPKKYDKMPPICARCGEEISDTTGPDGKIYKASDIVLISRKRHGETYCCDCMAALKRAKPEAVNDGD